MAGAPAPLAAVQAAVMKSAAGAAGQAKAAVAAPAIHAQSVAQDMAVMADQAKGYTAGVLAGNGMLEANRSQAGARMAQEAADAAAARSRQIAIDQMQTQESALRNQAAAQDAAQQMAAMRAAGEQARASRSRAARDEQESIDGMSESEREELEAATTAERRRVADIALYKEDPAKFAALQEVRKLATNPQEARDVFAGLKRSDPEAFGDITRDDIESFSKRYFDALNGTAITSSLANDDSERRRRAREQVEAAVRRMAEQNKSSGGGGGGRPWWQGGLIPGNLI